MKTNAPRVALLLPPGLPCDRALWIQTLSNIRGVADSTSIDPSAYDSITDRADAVLNGGCA